MHTILGAGGAIGNELAIQLYQNNQPFRLVGRNPKPFGNSETKTADLTDYNQTLEAVKGSSVVYLLAGLKYDLKVWKKNWPLIMRNTIEACKTNKTSLIFFDNIYCLGKVNGPMKEDTPFNPSSKKGEVRAQIANMLLEEINSGNLQGMIARSADFYGPHCKSSVLNLLVLDKMAKGQKAQWMLNDKVKHSFTFTPDCGKALWQLSQENTAWNQIWHIPTARPALTGEELITMAAGYFGVSPRYNILGKFLFRAGGLFNSLIHELNEMTYQNDSDYLFDSSKIENAFGILPTTYESGLKATVDSYRN
ncbi:MAG TPA: NAD-dependent epimerase/dehydratase family protein [Chitinophagaceae bacterium]|nr:NAD-dependent epimerase/dehydratase family protein [Chitinophagaceae bacterium]